MNKKYLLPATLGLALAGLCLLTASGCDPCSSGQCPTASSDYDVPFCRISSNGVGCSATLIDRNGTGGLVITCRHCIGGQNFRCEFTNGLTVDGRLLDSSPEHDLATFIIPEVAIRPAKLGNYDAQGSYRAFGFGGPSRQLAKIEGTVVESGMGYPGRPCCENINAAAIPGDSGSGTLDREDEFVGVLWGGNPRGALITMGTPVSEYLRGLVARGLWQPSSAFTPGGQPLAAAANSLAAYECSGFAWETCRRSSYCPPRVQTVIRELQPIWYGCPPGGCPPSGRNPIDPRDAAPRLPAIGSLIGIRGDAALITFAVLAGGVVIFSRYFRSYGA
jgi:hypothetical protein